MRLNIKTNADEVVRDLEAYVEDVRAVAFPAAAGRLRDRAQTAGLREIAKVYQIGPRTMERFVGTRIGTTAEGFEATIFARGNGFPLYVFNPRPASVFTGGRRSAGVAVTIKGKRHVFPGTFIARMKSGRIGIFARGAYGGKGIRGGATGNIGRFVLARGEHTKVGGKKIGPGLTINELYTLSPPDALANPEVTEAMQRVVEENADKEIRAALRFARRR